jgi:hypothetical protein
VSGTTSAGWPQSATAGERFLFPTLLAIGAIATVAATIIGNGNIVVAATPVLSLAALGALVLIPLRIPLFALIFLCLGLDATEEGIWDSPLAPIGKLLSQNLARTIQGVNLPFQLFAAVFVFLLGLHVYRRLTGSQIDSFAYRNVAKPLPLALAFSVLAALAEALNGSLRGGDIQMAKIQVQSFVLTLLLAYLLAAAMRGTRDYKILGWLVIAAACSKALLAIWIYRIVIPTMPANPGVATIHGDSMLFTAAMIMVISRFYEQPIRRHALLCLAVLPLLAYAIVANNRRLAWVEAGACLVALAIIGRRNQLKRIVAKCVVCAIPLFIAYVAVGWNSQSKIFAPVRTFRSVGDGQVDPSTLYRDLENFNLIQMVKEHPIVGAGFGQPYKIVVVMPDITFFKEWRFMPHNSVLGLWAFTGWLGFTCLSLAALVAAYFAARSYQVARTPIERTAAFSALAAILIYWIQCWGDIGFSERNGIFLVGPAIAIAGRLAVSTGAWNPLSETAR